MLTEPATERQLSYARDLGIQIHEGITKRDISHLIDMKLDNDKPATDRHKNFARKFGVETNEYIGKKALFDLIQYDLIKPGREKEMLSWFTYRVYRELAHGAEDAEIKGPDDPLIQQIAMQLENDEPLIKSVRKYQGRDLIWFGTFTSPDGYIHNGGSNRTAAYKKINALLKQSIGNISHKQERSSNAERSTEHQLKPSAPPQAVGTVAGLLKLLAWGVLILFGLMLLIAISGK